MADKLVYMPVSNYLCFTVFVMHDPVVCVTRPTTNNLVGLL